MKKVYYETDKNGKHKIIDNGKIKVKILVEPSSHYKELKINRKKQYNDQVKKSKVRFEKNELIQKRIRELAIKELKEEGKI